MTNSIFDDSSLFNCKANKQIKLSSCNCKLY
uniref:Uncharacterized protein n=1 Tax=Tetranychus urticae TaxID=32264 RepID=T1KFZ2_TETUR